MLRYASWLLFVAFFSIEFQGIETFSGPIITLTENNRTIVYSSTVVEKSKNATFQCTFEGDPQPAILWKKESSLLSNLSKYLIQTEGNVSLLTIIGVAADDLGNYSCNATNNHSSAVATASLIVIVYTTITQHPSSRKVKEGESSLNFSCVADGSPSPTFNWVKNDTFQLRETSRIAFLSQGKVLQITNVSRDDAGNFTCVASNGKNSVSRIATLTVEYLDKPSFNASSPDITLVENTALYVKCFSTSSPSASYKWHSNTGKVVSNSEVLSFSSISRNDTRSYFCNATNAAGSQVSQNLNVTVQYIDKPTVNVTLKEIKIIEKTALYMKCSSYSSPSATYEWHSSRGKVVSNTDVLSFSSINRNDTGTYFCNATNSAGSQISENLNVTVQYIDKPTVNVTLSEITMIEKTALYMKCSSSSFPSAIYKWHLSTGKVVSNTDVLLFSSISRNDSGSYFCNATNSAGSKVSKNISVTVQYIDKPTVNVTLNEITLIEKKALYMKCSSSSFPSAIYKWHSSTGNVVSNTDVLSFSSISRKDSGSYFCNATNSAGSKVSKNISVTVQYIDKPTVNVTLSEITLIEKTALYMKCSSSSFPSAIYKWHSSTGKVVSNTDVLSFSFISRNDSGSYFCNATNSAGSKVSKNISVTVQYIDKPTVNVTLSDITMIEKTALYMKCSTSSFPSAIYKWHSSTGKVVSNTDVLSFSSISRNDPGSYFCNATNSAGSKVSKNISVTVQYIDKPTVNVTLSEITLIEKKALYMKCSSSSLPSASYKWHSSTGKVVSNTDILSFSSINRNDSGTYFCNATNSAGSKVSKNVVITVHYIDKPTVNVTLSEITMIEKTALYMKCSSSSFPSAIYKWHLSTGKVVSNTDVLSFSSISRNDSGSYFCNATNSAGSKVSKNVSVTVQYIDKPTVNVSLSEITLIEKKALYMKCSSSSFPSAIYKWHSSTGKVVSTTDVLSFRSVSRNDMGTYICNASNAAGSQVSKKLTLTVQYIDKPSFNLSLNEVTLIEKTDLYVKCSSVQSPAASFKWISNKGKVVSNTDVLSFSSINRNDTGTYFCNATNAAGSQISENLNVTVQYIDLPHTNVTSSNIILVEKSSIYINCQANSSPAATYKWISSKGKIVSQTALLSFATINRSDTGSYSCNAANAAGSKTSTTVALNVQYIDGPQLNISSNRVEINEGSSLYVSCSSESSPAPNYRWISTSGRVVSHTNVIAFSSISRNDKGSYVCNATNAAGSQSSLSFIIVVQYLDTPVISPSSPVFTAGKNVLISCSAAGLPVPSYSWVNNTGGKENGSTYKWRPIYVNNGGTYTCSASNLFGKKETTITVNVIFSPLENDTIVSTGSVTQHTATVTLKKFNDVHGPISYYQVIVQKLTRNIMPTSDTNGVKAIGAYSASSKDNPYITAEFAPSVFGRSDIWDFTIGSGEKTNKTKTVARFRRSVTEYLNAPLDLNSYYTAFYRAHVSSTLYISSSWLPVFKTKVKEKVVGPTAGEITGIVIGVIVFLVLAFFVGYIVLKRRRFHNDKEVQQTATRKRPSFLTRSLHKPVQDPREPISISSFELHVNSLKANGGFGFSQEYTMISKELAHPHSHSTAPVNSLKNRYANIHAYDHSRVMLSRNVNPGSDYINANYIAGFNGAQEYIAAQGPLPETVSDFWRMVWEENSHTIVMLTKCFESGRPKCAQYWPSQGSQACNDLVVSIIETLEFPDHSIRTFHLSKVGQSDERTVKHFHFTGWPDHGVPNDASALFSLLKKVNRWRNTCAKVTVPLIVHCSAGVGRTGTYIALDTQINRVVHSQMINIYENVTDLRDQRCWMVQTEDQYAYLHHALLEFIKSGDTEIPAHELREYIKMKTDVDLKTGSTGLMDEFISLAKSDVKHNFAEANKTTNQTKNRYKNVYPYDSTRVKLSNIPGILGSDYINASYIDGYMQSEAFIATQAPLPGTFADFWRMVWEMDSQTIVMLSKEQEAGKIKVNKYWPEESSVKMWLLIIELLNVTDYSEYTLREFKVTNSEEGHSRVIRQFQYTAWPENSSPESAFGMIDLIGQVSKWNTSVGNRIVTIHCSAGVGRTGLFIALANLIERLKTEAVVDVYHAVRKLRQQRTAMVQTREQYEFCYRALQEYLDSFDHYANFE